ncbi:MAG: hypothetical protein ACE5JR_00015 [Gemmatimonadota bacterium]
MADSSLIKKLQVKPGQRMVVLNPPTGYVNGIGSLPEGAELATRATGRFDWVQLFAKNTSELKRFAPKAIKSLRDGGILWISYPKRSSQVETDLSRDKGWDVVRSAGLRPVSQVSIDDVWSALRFRPLKPGERMPAGL